MVEQVARLEEHALRQTRFDLPAPKTVGIQGMAEHRVCQREAKYVDVQRDPRQHSGVVADHHVCAVDAGRRVGRYLARQPYLLGDAGGQFGKRLQFEGVIRIRIAVRGRPRGQEVDSALGIHGEILRVLQQQLGGQ